MYYFARLIVVLPLIALVPNVAGAATAALPSLPDNGREQDKVLPVIETSRGQLLYENHCQGCHDSTLHVRTDRRIKTLADIRAQTQRWAGEQRLGWGSMDVDDVVHYLNQRYYRLSSSAEKR